jgi:hypothetical protein
VAVETAENAMMSIEGSSTGLQVNESTLDVDSSDIDVDDEMEMSSGMLSFASPTKRDSLDEGYDPNETIKVIVYEGNTIEIRQSTFGEVDDEDEEEEERTEFATDDERAMMSTVDPNEEDILSTDVQFSTGQHTGAEEEIESEELGSQDTYFYPSKFGLCRDYEVEEGESEKPIAIKPISIADPEPKKLSPRKKVSMMMIPGPPQYLTRSQTLDIPKIEVTDDEGESEPKKSRRGSKASIPDPVQYLKRDEKPEILQVEIHSEPSQMEEAIEVLKDEEKITKEGELDSNLDEQTRIVKPTRVVTFNIPEPVQYLERPEIRHKRALQKSEEISDGDVSDQDDMSGAKTSDSEVEEVTERKRFRPVTARTRVTSPLPDPVHYLSRRESEYSTLSDAIQTDNQTDGNGTVPETVVSLESDVPPQTVTFQPKELYKIPEPVCYMTRAEKLARLKQIANTGSVDSDTKVFNEIMRAVQASHASIDSDDVYGEIMKAFNVPSRSVDSNDVYNEIMSALKFDEKEDLLTTNRVDSVDLAPPEIYGFQDFISSSTYSTIQEPESPTKDVADDKVDKLCDDSPMRDTETDEGLKTRDSIDIPDNPVPSPVHYPSSSLAFDETSFTPTMVDGKLRKGSAKSLSKLRQHCSSRAHPCDCNDVKKHFYLISAVDHILGQCFPKSGPRTVFCL